MIKIIKVKLKNGYTGKLVNEVHVVYDNYPFIYTVSSDDIENISTESDRNNYFNLLRKVKSLGKNNKKLLNKVKNLRKLLRKNKKGI